MIISIDAGKTFDKISGERYLLSFWDDIRDRGYHIKWQIDKLDLKGVKWKMSLYTVTMCSFERQRWGLPQNGRQLAGLLPFLDGTVMGDADPLSLVVEVLPHFTSLHSSLLTNPSQNWTQVRLSQNPRLSSIRIILFSPFLLLWLLHFYFCPALLRYDGQIKMIHI